MRIDDVNRPPPAQASQRASGPADQASPSDTTAPDETKLSAAASSLAAHDTGRLEKLRQQVESGAYVPNAEAVAEALIDQHLPASPLNRRN